MTARQDVDAFLEQKTLALAGASRSGKKFGNRVLRELRSKGYEVLPVHPDAEEIDGIRCHPSLAELPKPVGGLVLVVPPTETRSLVAEAVVEGITQIWMQQGSESPEAIRLCEESGITAIHDECILMFAEPAAFIHRCHRWIWGALGKLPQEGAAARSDDGVH